MVERFRALFGQYSGLDEGVIVVTDPVLQTQSAVRPRLKPADWLGLAVLLALLVVGLSWSKWVPYWDRAWGLNETSVWDGDSLLASAGETMSFAGAWNFTLTYFDAVWKALLVALLVAAAIDALVRRDWLVRLMNRSSPIRQSVVGASLSMPSMMCTCCAAPVTAGLRRSGVSTGAALAYWIGNPLLNPAVLVFLALVLPWQYVTTRAVVGVLVAVVATALIGRWIGGRTNKVPDEPTEQPAVSELPGRFMRSLSRFTLVLVPEHLAMVFLMGLLSPWFAGIHGLEGRIGAFAIVIAAVVGTLLVIPTGGEIPIITALLAVGASAGTTGALLVALPALSIPSMVMVGKVFGWRATVATATAVVLGGILAGVMLLVLI